MRSDDEQNGDFEGFHGLNDLWPPFCMFKKNIPSESVGEVEEVDIEELFNTDNEAPVVHS